MADRKFDRDKAFNSIIGIGNQNIEKTTEEITTKKQEITITEEKRDDQALNLVSRPLKSESRSKRLYCLITPTLCKKVIKKCQTLNISLNEAINQLLDTWVNSDD